jgi:hypothetical protein
MAKQQRKRRPQFGFEVNEEFLSELQDISKRIQVPAAQIVREAAWEKLVTLRKTHPALTHETAEVSAN